MKPSHCRTLLWQTKKASTSLRCQLLWLLSIQSCVATYVKKTSNAANHPAQPSGWRPLRAAELLMSAERRDLYQMVLLTKAHMAEITWGFGSSFSGCGCSVLVTACHYVPHRLRRDKDKSRALALASASFYQSAFMWNICTYFLISLYVQTLISVWSEYWPC